MASVGQELKRERELRGISLKEIADSTKISLRLLRALENEHLEILPGKFFTKGIIRAYAKYLGLEEASVLNMYYEDTLLQEQAAETERKKRVSLGIPKDAKKVLPYVLLVAIILIIFVVIYNYFPRKKENTRLEKTPLPKVEQQQQIFLPPPPPTEEFAPEIKELNLQISFVEKTWIQVFADGELKVDGIKNPGEEVKLNASEELLLHLGNAGGIAYNLNGKEGKPLGRSGSVVKDIKITLDNIQEFLTQEEKNTNS